MCRNRTATTAFAGLAPAAALLAIAVLAGPAAAADVVIRGGGARTVVTYAHYLPPKVTAVGVDWTRQQQRVVVVERRSVAVVRARY
jgi:hypothetical protein